MRPGRRIRPRINTHMTTTRPPDRTVAQRDQEHNRDRDGRWQTKPHSEIDQGILTPWTHPDPTSTGARRVFGDPRDVPQSQLYFLCSAGQAEEVVHTEDPDGNGMQVWRIPAGTDVDGRGTVTGADIWGIRNDADPAWAGTLQFVADDDVDHVLAGIRATADQTRDRLAVAYATTEIRLTDAQERLEKAEHRVRRTERKLAKLRNDDDAEDAALVAADTDLRTAHEGVEQAELKVHELDKDLIASAEALENDTGSIHHEAIDDLLAARDLGVPRPLSPLFESSPVRGGTR